MKEKLEHFFKVCLPPNESRLRADNLIKAVKGVVHGTKATKLTLLWALSGFSDTLPISLEEMNLLLGDVPAAKLKTDRVYREHLARIAHDIFEKASRDEEQGLVRGCITLMTFIRLAPRVKGLGALLQINKQIRS